MKPFKQYLKESKSVDLDKAVYKNKIEGGYFVVLNRDTKGMAGSQDKFKMATVDDSGKIVNDLGSHPSENGAKKFGDKVKSVSFDPMKESLSEAKIDPRKKEKALDLIVTHTEASNDKEANEYLMDMMNSGMDIDEIITYFERG